MNYNGNLKEYDFSEFVGKVASRRKLTYEIYDENNIVEEYGKIETDDENDVIHLNSKPVKLSIKTDRDINNFLNKYPMSSRMYYNTYTYRKIYNKPIANTISPNVIDDFYLNILDWSSTGLLAVATTTGISLLKPDLQNSNYESIKDIPVVANLNKNKPKAGTRFDDEVNSNFPGYTSCKFYKEGNLLAAGSTTGEVELWDLTTMSILSRIHSHIQRVGVIDWLPEEAGTLLSSGSRDKSIFITDIRSPVYVVEWARHKQEVCGLTWKSMTPLLNFENNDIQTSTRFSEDDLTSSKFSEDDPSLSNGDENNDHGEENSVEENIRNLCVDNFNKANFQEKISLDKAKQNSFKTLQKVCDHSLQSCAYKPLLASGGNDNKVFIWELGYNIPILRLNEHTAAVKALTWSPLSYPLLATGGGTNDRTIRIWDTVHRTAITNCETQSQICNLHWSKKSLELISSHGYTLNQLNVWDFTVSGASKNNLRLRKLETMIGHRCRALFMSSSKDGNYIASGSGDGNILIWSPFYEG